VRPSNANRKLQHNHNGSLSESGFAGPQSPVREPRRAWWGCGQLGDDSYGGNKYHRTAINGPRKLLRAGGLRVKIQSVMRHEIHMNQKPRGERRHTDRFPIERELRYRTINKRGREEAGAGKTINMSSSGVLLISEHTLVPGRRVEFSVSWPAQLNDKCALKLVARGRVIRFEEGHRDSAVRIPHTRRAGR
jgi:PilZ domain-containing protein